MIFLNKLSGEKIMINCDMIELVTENPDTVIVMENGHSYIVEETMDEILALIKEYKRSIKRTRLERD
ncbi:MAG: flagellar FlbD family protein [Ruminiclostridium sp.]|nr:flagellar FlbD family protein [Ruminiclostridium sp.]MBQ8932231.1 flagellar FlbD family protein [Ruminiclostridium sp.]